MKYAIPVLLFTFIVISAQAAAVIPQCSNTLDDDGDGLVDLNDPDCRDSSDQLEGACFPVDPSDIAEDLQTSPESLTSPTGIGFVLSGLTGFPPEEPGASETFKEYTSPIDAINAGSQLAYWLGGVMFSYGG